MPLFKFKPMSDEKKVWDFIKRARKAHMTKMSTLYLSQQTRLPADVVERIMCDFEKEGLVKKRGH